MFQPAGLHRSTAAHIVPGFTIPHPSGHHITVPRTKIIPRSTNIFPSGTHRPVFLQIKPAPAFMQPPGTHRSRTIRKIPLFAIFQPTRLHPSLLIKIIPVPVYLLPAGHPFEITVQIKSLPFPCLPPLTYLFFWYLPFFLIRSEPFPSLHPLSVVCLRSINSRPCRKQHRTHKKYSQYFSFAFSHFLSPPFFSCDTSVY